MNARNWKLIKLIFKPGIVINNTPGHRSTGIPVPVPEQHFCSGSGSGSGEHF